jgi:hypothetical protein
MPRPRPAAFLLAALWTAAGIGCGKVGPVRPPLVLIPQRVDSLEARQLGGTILLTWKNPAVFIDGRPLGPVAEVEIWMEAAAGDKPPAEAEAFDAGLFLERARLVAAVPPDKLLVRKPGPEEAVPSVGYSYILGEKLAPGVEYVFAVRVREGRRKKLSELSNEVRVKPRLVPMPPDNVTASVFQDRVEIRWDAPFENFDHSAPAEVRGYNVYEVLPQGVEVKLNDAPVSAPPFADREFVFGLAVRYLVRAVASGPGEAVESQDSPLVEVVPKDTFPPAVPTGLASLGGPGTVTLSWNPNRETDFFGYKIWRRAEGGADFVLLTARPIPENAYADGSVEKGRRYDYAISAVDQTGNESGRSAVVSETIRDPE